MLLDIYFKLIQRWGGIMGSGWHRNKIGRKLIIVEDV